MPQILVANRRGGLVTTTKGIGLSGSGSNPHLSIMRKRSSVFIVQIAPKAKSHLLHAQLKFEANGNVHYIGPCQNLKSSARSAAKRPSGTMAPKRARLSARAKESIADKKSVGQDRANSRWIDPEKAKGRDSECPLPSTVPFELCSPE